MRFFNRFVLVGVLAVNAMLPVHLLGRQEPQEYRFATEVQIVPVSVFVTDQDGQPVEGLTVDDFVLKEEGELRPIVIFEPSSFQRLEAWRDSGEPIHPGLRRNFLLLFDLSFSSPKGILRAREAALDFVGNQLEPTDLVSVATYSQMEGLKTLCSFTEDHRQAERVVQTLGLVRSKDIVQDNLGFVFDPLLEIPEGPEGVPPDLDDDFQNAILDHLRALSQRMEQSQQDVYQSMAALYLQQFGVLNDALGSVSGRKFIVLLSEGIDSKYIVGTGVSNIEQDMEKFIAGDVHLINTDQRFGRIELRGLLLDTMKRAVGHDVSIYPFDVSGLSGDADRNQGQRGGQDTLLIMAKETGGRFHRNLNELKAPLQRLLKETSAFYLLGFRPKDLQQKGRFRSIDVEVRRKDVRVSARRGYFEPNPKDRLTPSQKALQLVEYVSKDIISDDVHFDLLVSFYPGQGQLARIPIYLKFPGKPFLEDVRNSDVMQLEIYGYAIDAEGRFTDFFNRTLSFDLIKEGERLRRGGLKYYDLLMARPGPVRIKIIARDVQTGKIGSFIEDLEIPDFTGDDFVVTPPVFVSAEPDWVVARGIDPQNIEPRRQGLPVSYPFRFEDREFIPAVRPSVRRDRSTNFLVRAYNLERDPETGQPSTEMKFQWVDPEGESGTIHQVALYQRPEEVSPGCYELVFQLKWSEVPEGPALLRFIMTDVLAGKTSQVESPYLLVP